MKYVLAAGLALVACIPPGTVPADLAPGVRVMEKYDEFTDRTNVNHLLLIDVPFLGSGASKEIKLVYSYPGRPRGGGATTIALAATLRSRGSDAEWRMLDHPRMYVLADASRRWDFPAADSDHQVRAGITMISINETVIYAIPVSTWGEIVAGNAVALRIGRWERALNADELGAVRAIVRANQPR